MKRTMTRFFKILDANLFPFFNMLYLLDSMKIERIF